MHREAPQSGDVRPAAAALAFEFANPDAALVRRPPSNQPTVLLVDNDSAVRESLGRVLAAERFKVMTAAGTKEALDCLQHHRPDLVITDLLMVPLTGWDLMLHVEDRRPGLPVFVITALPPRAAGGADRMATHFFQKPVDIDALVAAIRALFDGSAPEETKTKH